MKARKGYVNVELPMLKTGEEFNAIHQAGADQFGLTWLRANEAAVHACQGLGIDPSRPEMKRFVSLLVLRVLVQTKKAPAPTSKAVRALNRAHRLFNEALPKFNWGASALDANAITLLNEVPGEVRHAILSAGGKP